MNDCVRAKIIYMILELELQFATKAFKDNERNADGNFFFGTKTKDTRFLKIGWKSKGLVGLNIQ